MLRRMWEAWKRLAHRIGNFQARVLLTLFYAVAILPWGLIVRLFADPLRIRRPPDKWLGRENKVMDMAAARRQW
jgi:hypothetical protein